VDCLTWRPAAHDPLADVVEAITACAGGFAHRQERVLPSGTADLVMHVDVPYRLVTPEGTRPFPAACVSGLCDGPVLIESPPANSAGVVVRLRPWALRPLFDVAPGELHGRTLDLSDLLPRDASELLGRCRAAPDGAARMGVLREWLVARIGATRAGPARWAALHILERRGAVAVDLLRRATGQTWASLAAAFREDVGITAKQYARIVRFRHAVVLAHETTDRSLTTVALAAGYSDQSHMTREFRALGGITPREFRRRFRWPDAISVLEGRNLQDEPSCIA
jgi:AraC-like DNA-binding protein